MANRWFLIAVAALVVVRVYLHALLQQDFAVRPYRPGLAYKRFDFSIQDWDDERIRRTFKFLKGAEFDDSEGLDEIARSIDGSGTFWARSKESMDIASEGRGGRGIS
jgi:hypothetical protein